MFKELAPLLLQRAVTMTITCVKPDSIRVNVVPKKLADSENKALLTEVSITGTAEDLDNQLPSTLTEYVAAHLELQNTLDQAKEEMAAAAKAAKAEGKKGTSKTDVTKKGTTPLTKPVEEKKPIEPRTPSLFDMALAGDPTPAAAAPAAPVAQPGASEPKDEDADEDAEEEIIAEIAANDEGESEDDEEDEDDAIAA